MAVNFYGLTKIDFRLSENALWDACVAQWLIVSNESLNLLYFLLEIKRFRIDLETSVKYCSQKFTSHLLAMCI